MTWHRHCKNLSVLLLLLLSGVSSATVTYSGIGGDELRNVRLYVGLEQEPCDAPEWRVRQRFNRGDDEIAKALEGFGYYLPKIEKNLSFSDTCWQADFDITPGPPMLIEKTTFAIQGAAAEAPEFQALSTEGMTPNSRLDHSIYKSYKSALTTLSSELGFFDYHFDQARIDVWPEKQKAQIHLVYESGPRYTFGDITVNQAFLEPTLITKYLPDLQGQPYDSVELSQLHRSLAASGYFGSIQVRPNIDGRENGQVPIVLDLSPGQRIDYTVGGGFSTDVGPRLRGGYENRRLNRRGHQLNGELTLSEVISEISGTYRKPLGRPDVEWLSFSGGFQFENTDTSESDRFSLGVRTAKRLRNEWIRSTSLSLQLDRFVVAEERDDSRLLMPAVGFSHKQADFPINPRRGHSFRVEFRGASELLGSSTSFVQMISSIKLIRPVGEKGRLLLRGDLGTTFRDDLDELPPSVRFFAGGIDTVRGYGFQTLGSINDDGEVIGGSTLVTGSIEYERLFANDWAYAFFLDAGNAFDSESLEARVGVGAGVKWLSPIGPFRFYLAHPTNFSDRSVRLHISLGPDL